MTTNMLASATSLSNQDLLARLVALATHERQAAAELVAHLVALDMRPAVCAAEGYGSLYAYCTMALRLSEDAACNRIVVAAACRRFPAILGLLASGAMTMTSVRRLGGHLTPENCEAVIARAVNRTRPEIDALVAELDPQPDVASSVRKVPVRAVTVSSPAKPAQGVISLPPATTAAPPPVLTSAPGPIVQPSAPERYRVQFTIGAETHEKPLRVQALLRREIPNGDPGVIFDRALALLLAKVEQSKLAATANPRPRPVIRSGTDKTVAKGDAASRHVPSEVKRAVWQRDTGQCAFVAPTGTRCSERAYLEFHHVQPYAMDGPATVANISLRCRRHNQYEAELIFGPHGASTVREEGAAYGPGKLAPIHERDRGFAAVP